MAVRRKSAPSKSSPARAKSSAKSSAKPARKQAAPKTKARVSATIRARVWLDPRDGLIRIVVPGQFITTVSERPGKRLHKHLYSKLKAVLKKRGKWFELG